MLAQKPNQGKEAMSSRDVVLHAAAVDHERRLRAIEDLLGFSVEALPLGRLLELYQDALDPGELSPAAARSWVRQALVLDCSQWLMVTKVTGDPFPWQGMLARLDVLASHGFDVQDALEHVLVVAQGMLRAQGLALLRPRDVMGTAPIRHRAIRTIRKQIGDLR